MLESVFVVMAAPLPPQFAFDQKNARVVAGNPLLFCGTNDGQVLQLFSGAGSLPANDVYQA
ncbi:MAG: hypothetical protein NXI02_12810 [Rhodobacteraceae bacterium]|nr:hypothetical protein [Paracoccaceae bacterium]